MTVCRGLAIALVLTVFGPSAFGQELKPWKHGVIEPKGDAGFMSMVGQRDFASKYGLKVEIVSLKNGATAHKALLAGELDSIESSPGCHDSGRRTRRRHQDPGLRLARGAARADGEIDHRQGRGSQGEDHRGGCARLASQSADERNP